ncbi:MAG: sugar phosphate isomerase/epimerase [Bryobacteraceae bacterium]|jgi:sugar phosphate isomerase/epimerase
MKTPTTRRAFLSAASLAGLGVVAAPGAAARAETTPWEIKLGIATYSFRKFDRPKVIEMIRQVRTPWISVKNTPQQLATDSTPEQARSARQAFDAAGLKVMSIGNIDMTKANTVDDLRPLFELAKNFGAPMMVCAPTQGNLKAVEQMVREYDIRIAIHNHGPEDPHFPSAQSVLKAVSGLDPRCGLCMDVGHAYRAVRVPRLRAAMAAVKGDVSNTSNSEIVGALWEAAAARRGETTYEDDPVNVIAPAGARLFDMHIKDLKDLTDKDSQCDVGNGEIPVRDILEKLTKIHYQGCVNLEYEINADDPLPGVVRSFRYLRLVLTDLAAA